MEGSLPVGRDATPSLSKRSSPHATPRRAWPAWIAAVVLALVTVVPTPAQAQASTTWSRNLYVSGAMVYQDPYFTACTAASVMTWPSSTVAS